jgi:hypothetical protein
MPAYNGNIGDIFKGNGSILQKRPKFRGTSYGIYGKRT